VQYAKRKLSEQHFDYFVFGHRHLPLDIDLAATSKYINLGDWISYYSYGVFDGASLFLEYFEKDS
jgi:UDP-2,3-diacylglucosamine hydrolase